MKNTQDVQQPSEIQAPVAETLTSRCFPKEVLANYPWLLLGGVLAFFLSSAAIALYSLSYVERGESQEMEAVPEVGIEFESPTIITSQTTKVSNNPIPLWMVLLIASSCASGCLVIFRLLNPPVQQQKVKKTIKRYQSRWIQPHLLRLESRSTKNLPMFFPPSARKPFVTTQDEVEAKPVVTILPPEENFNQDNKESLANMMDIRKQTSLSALLRHY